MLDTIPSKEVTPSVSLSILKKLFELENNFGWRNDGQNWTIASNNSTSDTFARHAIVSQLVDTILTTEDCGILVEALEVLRTEPNNPIQSNRLHINANVDVFNYRNKLYEEILVKTTEGKFTLDQVCKAVLCLGKLENEGAFTFQHDLIDKLWVGIISKANDITGENILQLFRTIQYFKKSRRLVMSVIEKKIVTLLWHMDTKTVSEICGVLLMEEKNTLSENVKIRNSFNTSGGSNSSSHMASYNWGISARFFMALSKCIGLNIHLVKEEELIKVVKAFTVFNFHDQTIENVRISVAIRNRFVPVTLFL